MLKRVNLRHNTFLNMKKSSYADYKVSLIQKPGDSRERKVTLIPGVGIGRELASNLYY